MSFLESSPVLGCFRIPKSPPLQLFGSQTEGRSGGAVSKGGGATRAGLEGEGLALSPLTHSCCSGSPNRPPRPTSCRFSLGGLDTSYPPVGGVQCTREDIQEQAQPPNLVHLLPAGGLGSHFVSLSLIFPSVRKAYVLLSQRVAEAKPHLPP